ncbi:MAG: UDP-N-acetylmuramate--L-alanine ligase [Phycisphaerales bacterium]
MDRLADGLRVEGAGGGEGAGWLRGKSVYLIGIGGSGMSGLARLLAGYGASVSGSDASPGSATDALAGDGFAVGFDQASGRLPEACDLVVASAAIKPDHPQMMEATRRGIEHLSYAEALGRCMQGRTTVCVAGTHGKSTTTAMLGWTLAGAGLDPTVIVGATCPQLGASGGARGSSAGFRLGSATIPGGPLARRPGVLVAESCEFNRSFHNYRPTLAAINAVEADHLDVYGSLDAVVESFHQFANLIAPASEGGTLLIAHDGAHRREVTAGVRCAVQTIGYSPGADWRVTHDPAARKTTLALPEGAGECAWTMNMPGEHNAMNAATAAALALMLGAEAASVSNALSTFKGLDRRSQHVGTWRHPSGGEVRVYDDYGHHPTEVESTLRALRAFERPQDRGGRLICVFQPHQHSRTRHLLDEFANAFSEADVVIVPQIYFVRDSAEERQKVTAGDLVDRLRAKKVQAMHLYPFEAIVEHLQNTCRPGDLVVVMGAGPVNEVAFGLLGQQ